LVVELLLLLGKRTNVGVEDEWEKAALRNAVLVGRRAAVQLLEKSADAEAKDNDGRAALHMAA
jgi:hypothetical protein